LTVIHCYYYSQAKQCNAVLFVTPADATLLPNAQSKLLAILEELRSTEQVDPDVYDSLVRLAAMCGSGSEEEAAPAGTEVVTAVQEVQQRFSKKTSI